MTSILCQWWMDTHDLNVVVFYTEESYTCWNLFTVKKCEISIKFVICSGAASLLFPAHTCGYILRSMDRLKINYSWKQI